MFGREESKTDDGMRRTVKKKECRRAEDGGESKTRARREQDGARGTDDAGPVTLPSICTGYVES